MEVKHVVVDACVLTDIFIKTRKRHCLAEQFKNMMTEKNIRPLIPIHAAFEVKSAIENECLQHPNEVYNYIDPLKMDHVWLDRKFLEEYWDLSVPYIKAGDRYYILIAKKRNIPLVTEDSTQKKVAVKSGVKAFTIKEFLEEMEA